MYQPPQSCKPRKRQQGTVRRWQDVRLDAGEEGSHGEKRRRVRKGGYKGKRVRKKRVREREERGLDQGQMDERTHLNNGCVILLSERKIEMEDLRMRTKKTTICSIFFYRILSVGKVNRTRCHTGRQMFIQYPTNVIFKVPASVSADYFTGEQAEVGKWDLRSSERVHTHSCNKLSPLKVKQDCWRISREISVVWI